MCFCLVLCYLTLPSLTIPSGGRFWWRGDFTFAYELFNKAVVTFLLCVQMPWADHWSTSGTAGTADIGAGLQNVLLGREGSVGSSCPLFSVSLAPCLLLSTPLVVLLWSFVAINWVTELIIIFHQVNVISLNVQPHRELCQHNWKHHFHNHGNLF